MKNVLSNPVLVQANATNILTSSPPDMLNQTEYTYQSLEVNYNMWDETHIYTSVYRVLLFIHKSCSQFLLKIAYPNLCGEQN